MSDTRYNLRLPTKQYNRINDIAKRDEITRLEVIRRFIRLGLWLNDKLQDDYVITVEKDGKRENIIIIN